MTPTQSAVLILSLLLPSIPALALDNASNTALKQTQQMMTDPNQRQKTLDTDPRAKAMDTAARQAVGDQNAADVYQLASELMGTLADESGGDPVKMMELLQQAQRDPQSMEGKFTPEQKAKIKAMSERMPATVPMTPAQQNQQNPANQLK
jgi:hypothetical protein